MTKDMLDDVLKKFCSRQRDALAKEYIKQFGPGGNYLYIDYLSDLPAQLSANAKRMTNIEHIERANKGTLPDVFIGSWCYDATGYTRATRAPRGPNVKGDDWVRTECKSAMTITARGWSGNTNTMGDTCTIQSFKDAPARARKNASIALSVTAKCEGEYWVGPTEFWIVLKNDGKMSKIWLE